MSDVQYISDSKGKPVGVIVPIDIWRDIETGRLTNRINDLKKLFKKTQSLPAVKILTDADIEQEIEDYRNGK